MEKINEFTANEIKKFFDYLLKFKFFEDLKTS